MAAMKIGMLWFDNDTKTAFDTRIERAATYYRTKYGKEPTLCYIHPSMLPSEDQETDDTSASRGRQHAGLEVRTHPTVQPNHFWIGVNGSNGSG